MELTSTPDTTILEIKPPACDALGNEPHTGSSTVKWKNQFVKCYSKCDLNNNGKRKIEENIIVCYILTAETKYLTRKVKGRKAYFSKNCSF